MRAWFAAIFFLSFTLPAQQNQFKAGYFALPPHTENAVGHSGPAIHYFNKIAALMQVEVQYQQLPLSRLLKQLENNQLDAVLLLAQNPDRQQRFVYPQQPFLITQGALAVRTEIQTDASSFLSNPLYSIAIWQQGYQSSLLQNFAGRFVGLSGEHIGARAAEMLEKDRVDAFYEPDIYALRHSLEHHGYAAHFYILELPQDQVPLYTVFSRQGAVKYLQSYQQALAQQNKNMPYIEYLNQWLTTKAAKSRTKTPDSAHPSSH